MGDNHYSFSGADGRKIAARLRRARAQRAQRVQVDHQKLVDLFRRHTSGDYYTVAQRFAEHTNMAAIDRLKIFQLLRQLEAK